MSRNTFVRFAPATPDDELVSFMLNGDDDAFAELVERYFAMVVSIAIPIVGSRETAEELAQEVFLRVYMRMETLRQPKFFSSGLRGSPIIWPGTGRGAGSMFPGFFPLFI